MGLFLAPGLLILFAVVALNQVWNTFVAIANPRVVTIDDGSIAFSAFGRTDRYELPAIREFRIREFPTAGKMYVRVNGGGATRGRYWIQTRVMTEGDDLFRKLLDIEYAKHPDSIKARARRVNSKFMKRAS